MRTLIAFMFCLIAASAHASTVDLCDDRVESEQYMAFKWRLSVLGDAMNAQLLCDVPFKRFSEETLRRVEAKGCSSGSHVHSETLEMISAAKNKIEELSENDWLNSETGKKVVVRYLDRKGGCAKIADWAAKFLAGGDVQ